MQENGKRIQNPTLDALGELTEYVEGVLETAGVPMGVIAKMNIALDEIYSNIVKFSGASFAHITCGVENADTAFLIFTDDGVPFDPLQQQEPDVTLNAEEREKGGLGLLVVRKSMNTIMYEYAEKTNKLTLKLQF